MKALGLALLYRYAYAYYGWQGVWFINTFVFLYLAICSYLAKRWLEGGLDWFDAWRVERDMKRRKR